MTTMAIHPIRAMGAIHVIRRSILDPCTHAHGVDDKSEISGNALVEYLIQR